MHTALLLLSLFLSFSLSLSSSLSPSPLDDFYIAAVVEHNPNPQADRFPMSVAQAQAIIYQNLLTYEQHIQNATQQGAQIIVFNEYGLFGSNFKTRDDVLPFLETIPEVSLSSPVNPCANPQAYASLPTVLNISCLAQKYGLYVIVDMGDVQFCNSSVSGCPSDGRFQYNSLVAFGPDGELVAKYHKMHLYEEPYYDASSLDPVTFETNFGVRFGMLICFDMIFTDPGRVYFDNNVTDVVFSTEWENAFPFISALQIQQGWSRVFNANLIASGTGVGRVSSGSGIYSQGNVLADFFNPNEKTTDDRLIVAKVTKISNTSLPSKTAPKPASMPLSKLRDPVIALRSERNLIPYTHIFSATPGSSRHNIVGTNGALTCTFSYSVSNITMKTVEKYVLVVYEALEILKILPAPFQYCGLMRCDEELKLCGIVGQEIAAATVFDSFSISGNFNSSFTPFPLLSTAGGLLLPPQKITFDETSFAMATVGEFGEIVLGAAIIGMLSD